jgi:HEAT repeat protein
VLGTAALGGAHDRQSIPALLVLATQDPDDEVRGHAAASLAELDGIEDVAMLSAAEAKASAPLKVWFAAAAARIGDKPAIKRLAGYAASPDLAVAFKAGLAYADVSAPGDKGALAALTTLSTREAELNALAPYSGAVILSQMARLRHAKARKVLYGLLAEADENARLAAAIGLAKIGDDGGKEVLTQTMADAASPNRVSAAAGLVELGDYSGFALLQETLGSSDAGARAQAAEALGKIGEKESVRPLLALLEATEPSVKIAAAAALLAVVAIDPGVLAQEAVDWTGSALASADFKVRASGASVIGELPVKAALPLLAKAIADTEVPVRKAAATSAGKLRDREVASQLVAAVGTEGDASTKEAIVRSLGLIGDAVARDALLTIAADAGRLGVLASGSLIAIGDTAAVARLETDIRGGSRDIKLAVVDASVIARNRVVVPVLSTGNGDRDATVAFASAEALTGYDERGAAVVTTLQTAAAGKDLGMQARAIAALGRIGVTAPGVTLDPAAMLDSTDPAVRLAALAVIGSMPWATAKPLLRRASDDPSTDVRRAVADTLTRFVPSAPDDVVKQFKVLIDDRDAPVRTVAQAQLSKLVKPLAQPDGKPPSTTAAVTPTPDAAPAPPVVDLAPLQTAATAAEAAATATKQASSAFEAKAKLIEAAIAKPAADDAAIDAVAAMGKELATLADAVDAAAGPARDASATATAAATATSPDAAAVLARITAASGAATAAATAAGDRHASLKRKIADYLAADTGDPDMYLATADAALATGKLGEAKKNLDLASKAYKRTKTTSPGLFWSYGQLWDRMAQKESDPAKRRSLLTKAKQSLDSFASKGSGTRAGQARERSAEIAEELASAP